MFPRQIEKPSAFIATLGLQPQIVTRALDKLLVIDPEISQGTIIYTATYRFHPHWDTFERFQKHLKNEYKNIAWKWVPIQESEKTPILADVNTRKASELAFKVIFNETRELKRQGYRLHKLLAGGRKSVTVYSMVSAQLLFDLQDKLWHIFSDDEHHPNEGRRPHVPLTSIQLLEVPLLHLAGLMPMVRELLLHTDDPARAIGAITEHDDKEYLLQLHRFYDECEPIDQLLLWYRFRGVSNTEIVARVHVHEATIIRRLKKVAKRFYQDPVFGSRYTEMPEKPHQAILIALRPVLLHIEDPPDPPSSQE